jgi:hypothetical protein
MQKAFKSKFFNIIGNIKIFWIMSLISYFCTLYLEILYNSQIKNLKNFDTIKVTIWLAIYVFNENEKESSALNLQTKSKIKVSE